MDREEALKLLKKHLKKENLIKHSLAVESCMIECAKYFDEDSTKWGLAGLLHDLDYTYTLEKPEEHSLITEEYLTPFNLDRDIIHAIKAHNQKAELQSNMDIALYTIDPTTGFIIACALMHPSKKLENVNLKRMKKRFKEKNFARGAKREQMEKCTKMGIELDDFFHLCLKAMKKIHHKLGL